MGLSLIRNSPPLLVVTDPPVKRQGRWGKAVGGSRYEILSSFNKPEQYILALVAVGNEEVGDPLYVRRPFDVEPGRALDSIYFDWQALSSRGAAPEGDAVRCAHHILRGIAWPRRCRAGCRRRVR